jgi:ribonuclease G
VKPPAGSSLLVNRTAGEVRVALLAEGAPTAFYVERERDRGVVGNVYKGRVVRVVPGMQSAFVEVGLDRAAFLYVGDVQLPEPAVAPLDVSPEVARDLGITPSRTEDPTVIEDVSLTCAQGEPAPEPEEVEWPDFEKAPAPAPGDPRDPETTLRPVTPSTRRRSRPDRPRIEQLLRAGQEIVVQVSKEALGTKGARLTTQLAIPGRFLVYLPGSSHVGVSRRITDPAERERLRRLVEGLRLSGEGFIVRTVCEGRTDRILAADVAYLRDLWSEIDALRVMAAAPSLLHAELDLVLRATRDLLSPGIDRLVVDDPGDHDRVAGFIRRFMPTLADRLELYEDPVPLFESTGVERQVARALGRKVRLPSGGYIVIDHTEALTSIDVNSGRFTSGRDLEDTSVKVNLEAVQVVVEQLRLRDIGGLIVMDFIDMEDPENRLKVETALDLALEADPARSSVLPISEFGLVEMTRRRVRDDLARNLQTSCELCHGAGRLKSVETVAYEILREVARNAAAAPGSVRELLVRCEPSVARQLKQEEGRALDAMQRRLGAPVKLVGETHFQRERFAVSFQVRGADKP